MEISLAPSETDPRRVLTREQVLDALSGQGLEVATAETEPSNEKTRARSVLSFDQTDVVWSSRKHWMGSSSRRWISRCSMTVMSQTASALR